MSRVFHRVFSVDLGDDCELVVIHNIDAQNFLYIMLFVETRSSTVTEAPVEILHTNYVAI